MAQLFANGARAALSAGIAAGDTTLPIVSGGALFPIANTDTGAIGGATDWFKAVLDDGTNFEIVYIRTHTSASTSFTNVMRGQEGTTALSFSAGCALGVRVTAEDMRLSIGRERLTAARTYYVRTDGSDSNAGLVNTAGGAFLTVQKACDVICDSLDLQQFDVTVQLADGTYTAGTTMRAIIGSGSVTIKGNATTPANVLVSVTSNNCFATASGISRGLWIIKDMKLSTTTSGMCLRGGYGVELRYANINFGAAGSGHIYNPLGVISSIGNSTISGSAPFHMRGEGVGHIYNYYKTITLVGTPAFSSAFVSCDYGAVVILEGNTYSGSATGKQYAVNAGGYVRNDTTLPGSIPGTYASGGVIA